MVKVVLYLFLAIILISVIRSVVGVLGKGLAALFSPSEEPDQTTVPGEPRKAGELKRDPVCGVYVAAATAVKRTVAGQVVHFCSTECSEKYKS